MFRRNGVSARTVLCGTSVEREQYITSFQKTLKYKEQFQGQTAAVSGKRRLLAVELSWRNLYYLSGKYWFVPKYSIKFD